MRINPFILDLPDHRRDHVTVQEAFGAVFPAVLNGCGIIL